MVKEIIEAIKPEIKRPYRIAFTATKNTTTDKYLTVQKNGHIVGEIRIRFYAGTYQMLQLTPYIKRLDGMKENIVQYSDGKTYIDGENETITYNVRIPVKAREHIHLSAKNTDTSYDYNVSLDFSIQYGEIEA